MQHPVKRDAGARAPDDENARFPRRSLQLHAAEQRIVGAVFNPVKTGDALLGKNLVRRAEIADFISGDTNNLVRYLISEIDLMQGHNHRDAPLLRHLRKDIQKLDFMADIEKRGRLVEHDNLRAPDRWRGQA